jgi:hypothetical protein
MPKEQDPNVEVTVRDRRMFNPDGTLRQPLASEDSFAAVEPPIIASPPPAAANAPIIDEAFSEPDADEMPRPQGISPEFASLMEILATNTIIQLGAESQFGRGQINLEAARDLIDIIAMLQDKTAGNLSQDEHNMLNSMLTRLRMDYMGVVNQMSKNAKSSTLPGN